LKQKTAYEIETWLEFRRVLFRSGNFHLKFITLLASLIGLGAAILAWMIYHFIGFLYNLFFYQQLGLSFIEPPTSGLPWWIFAVQIGRASCRERVWRSHVDGAFSS